MKALGIVRKIDQLGRVVIPKEVRDTQGWKTGQPMEVFMSEEGMVLRPFAINGENQEIVNQLHSLAHYTDNLQAKEIFSKAIEMIQMGDA